MEYDGRNPILRKYLKQGINASCGMFMKNPNDECHKICEDFEDFTALLQTEDVTFFEAIGDHYVDVTCKSKIKTDIDVFSNLSIGVHIVNYAQKFVDIQITKLKNQFKSAKIYMVNSDCIGFTGKMKYHEIWNGIFEIWYHFASKVN